MNIASVAGAKAATVAQQAQAKESTLIQTVNAPEEIKRVDDTVEINSSRSDSAHKDDVGSAANAQAKMLSRMVERIIKEQYSEGNHFFMLFYGGKALELDPTLRPEPVVPAPEPVAAERQQAVVSAVEYFSPKQTAERILGAVEDAAGSFEVLKSNPAMNDAFRNAVGTAFVNVQNETGGILPEVTQSTYKITMQAFTALKAAG
jgi:hypothetical protein